MSGNSLCRIGVFYDGSYFAYAQNYFNHTRKLGWLQFRPFHVLLETLMKEREAGFSSYKVVYGAWFQGLLTPAQADEKKLLRDRQLHHNLMHAGIEAKFLPMSQAQGEKGVDVALALDAVQLANDGKLDVAVLVTGDGDMVPLVRALLKNGVRVMIAYFEYEDGKDRSFANERLLATSSYEVNVNRLEQDEEFKGAFKSLFWQGQPAPGAGSA
jgi:uncharacterized LabA/DUF88 family protein